LSQPKVGFLIGIFFLATFCFSCFESTFPLLLKHGYRPRAEDHLQVGYLFTYCGVIAAIIQGGLIGRLVKRFGEERLIVGSLFIVALSLALLPFQSALTGLLISLGLFAAGSGINRPPVFGLISLNSPPDEQGATLGVAQSAGSLARILGPLFATTAFYYKPSLPYLLCAVIAVLAAVLAWRFLIPEAVSIVPGQGPLRRPASPTEPG
jgi:DHA1 family tetracycline resistance protein-like MFS transporter